MFKVSLSNPPRERNKVNAFMRVRLESLPWSPVVYSLYALTHLSILSPTRGDCRWRHCLIPTCFMLLKKTFLFSFLLFSKIKKKKKGINTYLSPSYTLDLHQRRWIVKQNINIRGKDPKSSRCICPKIGFLDRVLNLSIRESHQKVLAISQQMF